MLERKKFDNPVCETSNTEIIKAKKKYFLPKIKLLFVCNKNAFRGNIFVGNISRAHINM